MVLNAASFTLEFCEPVSMIEYYNWMIRFWVTIMSASAFQVPVAQIKEGEYTKTIYNLVKEQR